MDQWVTTIMSIEGYDRSLPRATPQAKIRPTRRRLQLSNVSCLLLIIMLLLLSTSRRELHAATGFVPLRLTLRNRGKFHRDVVIGMTPPEESAKKNEIGIGIDLGTTFSAVAFLKDDTPTIIPVQHGRTLPSLVSLRTNGQVLVGKEAVGGNTDDAPPSEVGDKKGGPTTQAYCNVKRVIGTGGKIPKDIMQVVPFVLRNRNGKTYKKDSLVNQLHDAHEYPTLLRSSIDAKETIRPELITSYILKTLKSAAEQHTYCQVTRAVIGVPAYFHDAQREATKKAAEMAGIPKVKLLREPEAAALAYGIGKEQLALGTTQSASDSDELVLVFDLGGGTFDVSMLVVGGGVTEIISTSGDVQLGGSDFDARVANHFLKVLTAHGASPRNWSTEAKNAIVRCAEAVRIYLSNNRKARLALALLEESWTSRSSQMTPLDTVLFQSDCDEKEIGFSETGTSNSTHVLMEFPRRRMELLCYHDFQALLRPVREVAIMSGALLPGDSRPSLAEAALEMEEEYQQQQRQAEEEDLMFDDFYKDEKTTNDEPITEERILFQLQEADMKQAKKSQQKGRRRSRNVAKQERRYREERRKLENKKDTTRRPSSLSSAKDGGNVKIRDGISGRPISRVVLVGGATRMPAIGRLIATLTGVVPQRTVNPDEAVALGCAVHVGVLDGVEGMGTVLNPMQAAILRAAAEQQQKEGLLDTDDDFDDEFSEVVEFF